MDMETARLTNVSWLSIPDRHIVALRSAWWCRTVAPTWAASPANDQALPVPMLDWPSDLFADDIVCH